MDGKRPLAESGSPQTPGVERAALLKRTAIALGGIAAGGAAAAGFADASSSGNGGRKSHTDAKQTLSKRDREILELALRLEQLQNAFYGEAIRRGKLTGEAKQFAQVVGHEEHEHLLYIEDQLGEHSPKATKFKFGDATANDKQFIAAAAKIEDTGLAAYNGQAGNMSRGTLKSVARVISVEARHAAWARSLAGELPAPVAVDVPISASKALNAIKPYLA
jgi:rubrerythrin